MRPVYVKVSTVRSGKKTYRYLTLAESFRNEDGQPRSRIVARLGEVSEMTTSGELERIVEALSAQLGRGSSPQLTAESAPSYGAMAACDAYFSRLLLDELFESIGRRRRSSGLSDAVFAMVANRLSDPSSKRRCVNDWLGADAALPEARRAPSLDRLYRGLDAVADAKDEIEAHLFAELCNLTNLDLRLVCYDLTSTYFEGEEGPRSAFPQRPSATAAITAGTAPDRDRTARHLRRHPIAHHVFSGNTADRSTLPEVMADLQARFGVGRIALVADRGLISEENLVLVQANGFDHVLATRLHREPAVAAVLEAAANEQAVFVPVGDDGTKATEVVYESRRYVVVDSPAATFETTPGAKSSSPRPKTDSSPCQNACARAASSTRQDRCRSRQDPQGLGGQPVLFDQDHPRGVHLGLRREGHGLRGETPRRPLCDHDLARQQDRLDRPGRRSLQESSVSRTALSRAEGLLRVDSIIIT